MVRVDSHQHRITGIKFVGKDFVAKNRRYEISFKCQGVSVRLLYSFVHPSHISISFPKGDGDHGWLGQVSYTLFSSDTRSGQKVICTSWNPRTVVKISLVYFYFHSFSCLVISWNIFVKKINKLRAPVEFFNQMH